MGKRWIYRKLVMKKNQILILFLLFLSFQLKAQKYFTRSGVTQFEASEKAFEPIEAINNTTTVILDIANGSILSQVFIAGFQFKNALMQEHFNENYMDTYQYPKATFKGNLINLSLENLNAVERFELSGTLSVRGIEKSIETKVNVKNKNNQIYISGMFFVSPQDFQIKIPSIVRDKVAKQIQINIDYELIEKK
jgi:hypothetical protein